MQQEKLDNRDEESREEKLYSRDYEGNNQGGKEISKGPIGCLIPANYRRLQDFEFPGNVLTRRQT